MTTIRVPYGRSFATAEVSDDVDVIEIQSAEAAPDPTAATHEALADPIGGFTWRGATSVAIAINDKTRPVPHQHLLPPLLDRLTEAGIPTDAITFYVAVGGHSPMTEPEFSEIVPQQILDRYRVVSHDAASGDLMTLGETSRGTPATVNRGFVESDLKIVVGTIEPHQFAGFSGGVKSAAIGLAGPDTIDRNHAWMTDPASRIGTYETNPARQDIEELGEMIDIDLALNVIVNSGREIVRVLAGDPVTVMEVGAPLARRYSQVGVANRYDVVVASPGGHPKDINVYQSQKAIASAAGIVRSGGTIVLTAACPEGSGSAAYEQWVANHTTNEDVLEAFREEGFRVGPHKAFQIARDSVDSPLIVVTDMPDELTRRLLLTTAPDLQTALDDAGTPNGPVAVLPHASTTIPYVS
ncbi:MAG: nickel-dependent lactate racemase [Acidimicrobiia bacterium]|nr:nickel-dependent lactate racemase [Acidimicrobiia bacterium]NNC75114.1 nickel-dependent lactate racemase [Acidimicrobiia bacterium]